MSRSYKARNKRIIYRSSNGKFRKSTLSDIGLGCCENCGKIFTPDYNDVYDNGCPFIDPVKFRKIGKLCKECLKGLNNG